MAIAPPPSTVSTEMDFQPVVGNIGVALVADAIASRPMLDIAAVVAGGDRIPVANAVTGLPAGKPVVVDAEGGIRPW